MNQQAIGDTRCAVPKMNTCRVRKKFRLLRDKFDKEFISFARSIVCVFIIQVVLSSKDVQAKTRKPTSNFFVFYIVRAHTTDHLISLSDIEHNSGISSKKDEKIADWSPACAYWCLRLEPLEKVSSFRAIHCCMIWRRKDDEVCGVFFRIDLHFTGAAKQKHSCELSVCDWTLCRWLKFYTHIFFKRNFISG